jgi:hypothetical protein
MCGSYAVNAVTVVSRYIRNKCEAIVPPSVPDSLLKTQKGGDVYASHVIDHMLSSIPGVITPHKDYVMCCQTPDGWQETKSPRAFTWPVMVKGVVFTTILLEGPMYGPLSQRKEAFDIGMMCLELPKETQHAIEVKCKLYRMFSTTRDIVKPQVNRYKSLTRTTMWYLFLDGLVPFDKILRAQCDYTRRYGNQRSFIHIRPRRPTA